VAIDVRQVDSEALLCAGYSPVLEFVVPDLDAVLPRLLAAGGVLDGAVQWRLLSRSAVVRLPTGHMAQLVQHTQPPRSPHPAGAAVTTAAPPLQ